MRKLIFISSILLFLSLHMHAQKGKNQIGIAFEPGLPLGKFGEVTRFGIGGALKFLFGTGRSAQVTLSTGFISFSALDVLQGESDHMNIVPILLGYRIIQSGAYFEPQVGYGNYTEHFSDGTNSTSASAGIFTWGASAGFADSYYDFGVRYQRGSKDGYAYQFVGLHLGVNIPLGNFKR